MGPLVCHPAVTGAVSQGVVVVGAGQAAAEFIRVMRKGGFSDPIRVFGREGFPPYDRPPLSKAFLTQGGDPNRLLFRSSDAYQQDGIELSTGCAVTEIDAAHHLVRLGNGETVPYSICVLATGADARLPNLPGADLPGVHVLRTIEDAAKLRSAMTPGQRLVVVGGGYLGLEVASSARACGADVVVVESASALMQRSISALTATALEHKHRAEGSHLLIGASIQAINGDTRVRSVTTSHGEVIEAQAVLIAIGASPAVHLARDAGVRCENGIIVDAGCRTDTDRIYAIGDCANQFHPSYGRHIRLEAISSALFHARCAAADIMGKPLPTPKPPSFWSEQCGSMLQILGVPRPDVACDDVWRGDESAFIVYRFQNSELVAVEALNRPKDFVRAHAMLGRRDVELPAE